MNFLRHPGRWAAVRGLAWILAASLTACGGGGGDDDAPPVPPPAAATLGTAGGTVTHASGATIEVPAGALSADTTIRVAQDGSGAPALPAELTVAGPVFALTPHGSRFDAPVRVRIPTGGVTVGPDQQLMLAKAEVGGAWQVLADSAVDEQGMLTAAVSSFSYFGTVLVTYPVPITQASPLRLEEISFSCGEQSCRSLAATAQLQIDLRFTGTMLPGQCAQDTLQFSVEDSGGGQWQSAALGSGRYRLSATVSEDAVYSDRFERLLVKLNCQNRYWLNQIITWSTPGIFYYQWVLSSTSYPELRALGMPPTTQVIPDQPTTVRAVLAGGAFQNDRSTASATDQAIVEWQRSDDGGGAWRHVGFSYQSEANQNPFDQQNLAGGYWQVSHGFTARAADAGALIRVRACYTPPDPAVRPPACATSTATRLNVLQSSAPPAIDTPPRSVLVRVGQTASFTATATGTPTPSLQWQTREANSGGAWSDVAGATGGTYTTAVLAAADNGRQVRVVATNALGTAESAPVTVSVSDVDVAPTITTQPAGIAVTAGGDAVFAVAARGTEALSYQWRFNGSPITGANAAVLRLGAVSAAQAGRYSVQVSNAAGSVTSNEATLSVTAGAPAPVAPTIVTPPGAVRVNAGNTATFAVGVGGSAPFSYQWLRNGEPIAGATAAYFSLASANRTDEGSYAVRVSNEVGSVTSAAASLTVIDEPPPAPLPVSLDTLPAAQVQLPGGSATFAVAASGTGPLSYQWSRNGVPLVGATGPVLRIAPVSSSDAGNYTVAVSNAVGSVTSPGASLTVVGAPVITVQPQARSVTAGASATFSVSATGTGLGYQWVRNGVAIVGATATSHTTPVLTTADGGAVYSVIVYNGAGVALSQLATLTVQPAPTSGVTLTLASPAAAGGPANAAVSQPSASADGQRVAFLANGTGLVTGQGGSADHAYVRDLAGGTTRLVNITAAGGTSARGVNFVKLAAGGRHVLFTSLANDLVGDDTNIAEDVFVRDLQTGITTRVNLLADGSEDRTSGNNVGARPDISADGRFVLMSSGANLAGGGEQGAVAYYLHDRDTGATRRLTLAGTPLGDNGALRADGLEALVLTQLSTGPLALEAVDTETGVSSVVFSTDPADNLSAGSAQNLVVSADGRFLAFVLYSPTWFGGAAASRGQIVVFDRQAGGALPGGLTLVSASAGTAGNGSSDYPSISADGRYVGYRTAAANLTGGLANAAAPLLVVHDRQTGANTVVSRSSTGTAVSTPADAQAVLGNGSGAVFLAPAQQMLGGSVADSWQAFVAPRP